MIGIACLGDGGAGVAFYTNRDDPEDLANALLPHPTLSKSFAKAVREALGNSI